MDYFNKLLPVDITVDILARLPTESVLDSKLVCTRWRNVVSSHPSFSKIHLHHHLNNPSSTADPREYCKLGFLALSYAKKSGIGSFFYYFEYNEKNHDDDEEEEESTKSIQSIKRIKFTSPFRLNKFVGSCNGLVCVLSYLSDPDLRVCIFNPITREYVLLPVIETEFRFHIGFGYVSSTNEYKVLLMKGVNGDVSLTNYDLHIYTLGSPSGWRKLNENFDFSGEDLNISGMLVKEVLYWMDVKSKRIVNFDLVEEKFCEHLSPPLLPPKNHLYSIGVLNGLLFFALGDRPLFFAPGSGQEDIDIWLLKKKKPNHEKEEVEEHQSMCWRKEFRIDTWLLLAITKSGDVFTYDDNYLKIYNTKTLISKSHVKFENWIHHVIPHENTLVSLKELGEEDTKVMEAVEETNSREQLLEDTEHEYIYL